MARLVLVLILALVPAQALAQSADTAAPSSWRIPQPDFPSTASPGGRVVAGTDVAPNATFGLGVFGLKPITGMQAPVTARELNSPKSRRAGIGLRVRF